MAMCGGELRPRSAQSRTTVVHAAVFVFALGGGVPAFVFAAAAYVGQDEGVAFRQPVAADVAQIMRQFGHVEAAVGVNKRRGVGAAVFADVEIRYLRAVCRTRPKLPYGDAVCVELFGLAAQDAQFVYLQVECVQGQRGGEVACGDVEQVAAPRLVGQFQRALRQFGQDLFLPCFARPFPCFQTAFEIQCAVYRSDYSTNTSTRRASAPLPASVSLGLRSSICLSGTPKPSNTVRTANARCFDSSSLTCALPVLS